MIDNIKLMTKSECQAEIKKLEKQYDFKQPLAKYTNEVDHVINTLLYLEGRIEEIDTSEAALRGVETRTVNMNLLTAIMTPKGRAENLKAAAELMGYKKNTIHTYLSSKPTEYYRCE
jgi:hypothetical protein